MLLIKLFIHRLLCWNYADNISKTFTGYRIWMKICVFIQRSNHVNFLELLYKFKLVRKLHDLHLL